MPERAADDGKYPRMDEGRVEPYPGYTAAENVREAKYVSMVSVYRKTHKTKKALLARLNSLQCTFPEDLVTKGEIESKNADRKYYRMDENGVEPYPGYSVAENKREKQCQFIVNVLERINFSITKIWADNRNLQCSLRKLD